MSRVKNYDVGQIHLDLLTSHDNGDSPYLRYVHELPLLSFGDIQHSVNLSLVFNYKRYKDEKKNNKNPFLIAPGFKLNLQKHLCFDESDLLTSFQGEDGKVINLKSYIDRFTFDDESRRILKRIPKSTDSPPLLEGDTEYESNYPPYTYTIEHSDLSSETYNQAGKIAATYDKYGDSAILSYNYNQSGQLSSIVFRGGNTITLSYNNSNRLESITYNNQTITFFYNTDGTLNYIEHYTGVQYTFSVSEVENTDDIYELDLPKSIFSVNASAEENDGPVLYSKELVLNNNGKTVEIIDKAGTTEIHKNAYRLQESVLLSGASPDYIDTIDNNGTEIRTQFENEKPFCSYEIHNGVPMFEGDHEENVPADNERHTCHFLGHVTLHGNSKSTEPCGIQTYASCKQLNYNYTTHEWNMNLGAIGAEGYYTLSGWIKLNTLNINNNTYTIRYNNIGFEVFLAPLGQWKYFSHTFRSSPFIMNINVGDGNVVSTRDFRISYQGERKLSDGTISEPWMTENVLLYGNDELLFKNAEFRVSSSIASNDITLSGDSNIQFSDIVRYKLMQKKYGTMNHVYYNDCKDIIIGATAFDVLYNGNRISIDDFDLGVKQYSGNTVSFTRMDFDVRTSGSNITKTTRLAKTVMVKTDDDEEEIEIIPALVSTELLNPQLDVIESTADGITTFYSRDSRGRIISESVSGLYKQETTYDTALITVTNIHPNTNVTINSRKYYIDSAWGVVTKVDMLDSDGTVQSTTINTYDDAKGALLTKSFDNMLIRKNTFGYQKGQLASITGGLLNYNFEYSNKGELTNVSKNQADVECHSYSKVSNTSTVQSAYPNSDNASYTENKVFDKYGRLQSVAGVLENIYRINPLWTYFKNEPIQSTLLTNDNAEEYNRATHGDLYHTCIISDAKDAALSESHDHLAQECTEYGYDRGRLIATVTRALPENNSSLLRQEVFVYDKANRLKKDRFEYNTVVNGCVESEIVYKIAETSPLADNRIDSYSYKINSTEKAKTVNNYDTYKRVVSKQHIVDGMPFYKSIGYNGNRISSIMDTPGGNTVYQYDDFGRITSISSNNVPVTYKYNTYGQLTRENNKILDKTFVYQYNNNGCLTKVKEYAYATGTPTGTAVETAFTYDGTHPDRLTSFGSTSISYNAMGCPTTVHSYNATWTRGKLAGLSKGNPLSGSHAYSYSYNALGQRVSSGYTFTPGASNGSAVATGMLTGYGKAFRYDQSGRLIYEGRTCQYYSEASTSDNIVYLYDECGMIGMVYTDESGTATPYYFQRNLLGDVIGIYNTSGTKVGGYAYDAWGNCTITLNTNGIATRNPIRYRGYYYDEETGLYYLNARYYSPAWRRFISPDDTAYLDTENPNGLNLYTYCGNNPLIVNYSSWNNYKELPNKLINVSPITNIAVPKNTGGIHFETEWFVTGLPSFLVFSPTKVAIADWGLSVFKSAFYFDTAENHSLYASTGNVSLFVGYNVEKEKYGVFMDTNVLSVGYDGRYIDAGISVVGVGIIVGLKNKKLRIKCDPPGCFGFDVSIDIGQIIKDVFGWEW